MFNFLVFMFLLLAAPFPVLAEYWEPHWISRVSTIGFHNNSIGQRKTVIYGDSNTEAFWWGQVSNCTVLNAGMGGARIKQLAGNASYIAALTMPKIVHVMVGTNNLGMDRNSPEWQTMATDLRTIVSSFQAVGAKVVLWPVMPVDQSKAATMPLADRAYINTLIQSEAYAYGAFWDWWFPQQYENSSGYAVAGSMLSDGIHFSASTQLGRYNRLVVWHQYIKDTTGVACN